MSGKGRGGLSSRQTPQCSNHQLLRSSNTVSCREFAPLVMDMLQGPWCKLCCTQVKEAQKGSSAGRCLRHLLQFVTFKSLYLILQLRFRAGREELHIIVKIVCRGKSLAAYRSLQAAET